MPDPGDSSRSTRTGTQEGSWLSLDIVDDYGKWSGVEPVLGLVLAAGDSLARHRRFAGDEPKSACILLSDASHVRRLNAQYRGLDKATNVLSFPAASTTSVPVDEPESLGDIVLAQDVVAQEATDQGVSVEHHLQHLVIHGLLHLMGFDHERGEDADLMEGLEVEILASLDIPDPYSVPSDAIGDDAPARRHSA